MLRQVPRCVLAGNAERARRMEHRSYAETDAYGRFHNYGDDEGFAGAFNAMKCPGPSCVDSRGRQIAHLSQLLIATDGACRGNGPRASVMGIGVDFGNIDHNISDATEIPSWPSTNQRAEILAATEALRAAKHVVELGNAGTRIQSITIKTDSQSVVKAMTDWIKTWRINGYLGWHNQPVVNEPFFRQLDAEIDELNAMGVVVLLYHVPRNHNQVADALANQALNRILN